jgi:hypothetical protein
VIVPVFVHPGCRSDPRTALLRDRTAVAIVWPQRPVSDPACGRVSFVSDVLVPAAHRRRPRRRARARVGVDPADASDARPHRHDRRPRPQARLRRRDRRGLAAGPRDRRRVRLARRDGLHLQRARAARPHDRRAEAPPAHRPVALKRQPWNAEECAAGGIVECHPDDFASATTRATCSPTHRRFFTTNPSVYPAALCAQGWPQVPQSEGMFTHRLLEDPDVRFRVLGREVRPAARRAHRRRAHRARLLTVLVISPHLDDAVFSCSGCSRARPS